MPDTLNTPATAGQSVVKTLLASLVPDQIRTEAREQQVAALASSIQEIGQQEPIRLRRLSDGSLAIIDGHGRALALIRLGHTEVDAIIEETPLTLEEARLRQLASFCRSDLDPIARGRAYDEALRQSEMTAAKLAAIAGTSEAMVSRYRSLVGVRQEVQELVIAGKLGMSLAVALSITGPEERFQELVQRARTGTLTRADLNTTRKGVRPRRCAPSAQPHRAKVIKLGQGCSVKLGATIRSLDQVVDLMAEYVRRFRDGVLGPSDGMPSSTSPT